MDKLAILQITSFFSVIFAVASLMTGYWAIARTQVNNARRWNVATIATTGISAVHASVEYHWYAHTRGWAWPSWNFYELMVFAFMLFILSLFLVGFHLYTVWHFCGRVKHARGT